ncbi:Permease of the drug/metabolite transporter (DMT) superfamily [Prosthecobacter debontii]|uniref:Permease of the drug/metabolite transporter (DMT) superfamily n=1 Tax=Prosthecobacter debontii TaxID=48467 RepID=A0A1T4YTX9_9BACT|nr:DMT family transporter [Prosthecobacter debontii]SKB05249.1 Permease of the drug/metabolite transporter (DMT) superfamily [Prosthecobacter debontii]
MKTSSSRAVWASAIPFLFVLLWSSGFIGSKLGVPYAEPFTFLTLRYIIVLTVMVPVSFLTRAPWPQGWKQVAHVAFAGLLIHALYLSGCVYALRLGLPAGIVSLIVSMQPLFTAALAGMVLGEKVLPRQWLGLALGFVGTAMVVSHKMGSGVTLPMTLPAILALIGITLGTLWQKRHCPTFDLRTSTAVQYLASLFITAPLSLAFETREVHWSGQFVFALLWVAFVLSIGAITLLNYLIRSGTAVNVASLFYTVPAVTAFMAWAIFGETLTGLSLAGMGVAVLGVWLARGR